MQATNLISNPPYNIKWNPSRLGEVGSFLFSPCEIPPENNANFAFVLIGLAKITGKAVFLLPCGVLSSVDPKEVAIKKYLVDSGLLSAVVMLPANMFESTSIPVCLLIFDKQKPVDNVIFVDLREQCEVEERKQRGQYGNSSHTDRVYIKKVMVIPENIMDKVAHLIHEREEMPSFAMLVPNDDIATQEYNLSPGRYFPIEADPDNHREFGAIVDDLNRIATLKNVLKLTMNATVAERMGFTGLAEMQKRANEMTDEQEELIERLTSKKLVKADYFALSKNRNELKFENKHPEIISEIFLSILQMWKAHIMFLNNEENRYIAELRDALLPKLMSGEIEV